MDLTDDVERGTHGWPWLRRRQQCARLLRVVLGIRPCASHLPDLGTVDQAFAAIAHEIGLRRTPLTEARRPLVRAAHVEDFVTRLENAAIDVPRENGRHIAGDDCRHRFIQQGDTFGNAPHAYQRPPASVTGERGEVAIGKTLSDPGGLAEHVVRRRRIALADALDREWNQEIASHHAFEPCLVEQMFRSDEPARGGSESAALKETECQPERGPRRALPVTSVEELRDARDP